MRIHGDVNGKQVESQQQMHRLRLGRPQTVNVREIVNGILFLATSGCQWRQLPKDFPPMTTVQRHSTNPARAAERCSSCCSPFPL